MNENLVISILIIFIALLFSAIGFWGATKYISYKSKSFRVKHLVPDIIGTWYCQWFDDEGDPVTPKIQDTIEIQKWIIDGEFVAVGHQPEFHLSYPISGEVDPSRVVTLEYRASKYPYEVNRGVVCMILSCDDQKMVGKWFGRRSTGNLGGGKVVCSRNAFAS